MKTGVALPGEGIGVEVVDAACEIIAGAGMPVKILVDDVALVLPLVGADVGAVPPQRK